MVVIIRKKPPKDGSNGHACSIPIPLDQVWITKTRAGQGYARAIGSAVDGIVPPWENGGHPPAITASRSLLK
jgi:hypothetical protein